MGSKYYDGTKLLSLKDSTGETPEIFIVDGNRTGGKTTYFSRLLVNRFIKNNKKFMLVYRYKNELADVSEKFFSDIGSLFFPNYYMEDKSFDKNNFRALYINGEHCGFAVSLNSADSVKKQSHLFNDIDAMFMDEFQSETNTYVSDECTKIISIHTSVARGHGKQVRYVPLYMCSNSVSLLNPYYVAFGISTRLRDDTKFLRGDGFVLEKNFNETASEAQRTSGFNRAFAGHKYIDYSSQGVYLNDSKAFVESPKGNSRYLCTIKYNGREFAIREFADVGIIYCDDKPDRTYPHKFSITTEDHNVNYVMIKRSDLFVANMRFFFDRGAFRFKNLLCKEAIMNMLAYI